MRSSKLNEALGYVDDRYLNMVDNTPKEATRMNSQYHTRTYKRIIAVAAAVAVFLALGVVAYAADLFGIRALLRPEKVEIKGVEFSGVSLTQPQEVPEELGNSLAEKVSNSEAAWAEWEAWRQANMPVLPAVFDRPEGSYGMDIYENPDGSYTIDFCGLSPAPYAERPVVETRTATAEEYEQFTEYSEAVYGDGIAGYDFNYHVYSQTAADKLEEIAAKYELALRGEPHLAWSSDTAGRTGEGFYTNEELTEMTAKIGCEGNIFYETPAGFDKVYWYDDGTFCVSFYVTLDSGEQARCYGYNSMYSTLSSGEEVVNWETDLSAFTQRLHTTPDGTEVTILSNGADAYIYVYLENSFFAERVTCEAGLTDADLDAIADGLQYSLIGK